MSVGIDLDEKLAALDKSITALAASDVTLDAKLMALGNGYRSLMSDVANLVTVVNAIGEMLKPVAPIKLALGAVSYYYPGPKWDAVLAKKPAVTIINPSSGPGTGPSATYATQVQKAKAAGSTVLGYVWTDYGKRPIADVLADCTKYLTWYPDKAQQVTGFFLDEASNTDLALPYYTEICSLLKFKGYEVCLNPGTKTLEGYAKIADWLMTFEGAAVDYATRVTPAWEANYKSKIWHVVHSCPAASMPSIVSKAKHLAGLCWVTDDVMNNPYDTNATYLDALAAEVSK